MDREKMEALAEPFDPKEVSWKPQSVRGNRALAIAYIDARCVMDRLDEVIGPEGWKDSFTVLPNGSVVCTLSVLLDGCWIEKCDVGSQSDQPDEGDRMKAAFSDALKRAAVKYGIGRYLYNLSSSWVDYDPTTRKFVKEPTLPAWAVPKSKQQKPRTGIKDAAVKILETAAEKGTAAVRTAYSALSKDMRESLTVADTDRIKGIAAEKDEVLGKWTAWLKTDPDPQKFNKAWKERKDSPEIRGILEEHAKKFGQVYDQDTDSWLPPAAGVPA